MTPDPLSRSRATPGGPPIQGLLSVFYVVFASMSYVTGFKDFDRYAENLGRPYRNSGATQDATANSCAPEARGAVADCMRPRTPARAGPV